MAKSGEPIPWSLRPAPLRWRSLANIGAGALVASFFIGTADITIATRMGARFGFDMWWTYFILGLAGWAMMDMSVRYYLQHGRTPLSLFKELHPLLCFYLLVTVVVTTIVGAYSQWNACSIVLTGFMPGLPTELAGGGAALVALIVIGTGAYRRIETLFVVGLFLLVSLFAVAASRVEVPWGEAAAGLVPSLPREPKDEWMGLLRGNAGSLINAWLILVYPYTMIEKGWFARGAQERANLLRRARWDYGVGIAAAGVVALPIMAAAYGVAGRFGIVPRNETEFAVILEPVAGELARSLFLGGLFLAAWTAGVGWMICGAYAILDLGGMKLRMDSRGFRFCLLVFTITSAALLVLRVNPFDGIYVFTVLLSVVFPVVALAMVWRISRPDMGYFRWWPRHARGWSVILIDLFALTISLYVGWSLLWRLFR